jgi:23S rRNA pseudouridine1911/1915/1917 synthase
VNAELKTRAVTIAEPLPGDTRIDTYIADHLGLFSRSQAKRRVVAVRVNGRQAKLSRHLRAGDELEITYTDPPAPAARPEAIPLEVLYEDPNVIVVNKPSGMVVHPASGNWTGTLVNALLHHSSQLAASFGDEAVRAGIVHRLDKETSGVIIAAKNPAAQEFLARQFRERRVAKQYLAVVRGSPPAARGVVDTRLGRDPRNRKRFACLGSAAAGLRSGSVGQGSASRGQRSPQGGQRSPQGGKRAVTRYRQLRAVAGFTFLSLRPVTGRTHQLRVHMAFLGCPILGDALYGGGRPEAGLMLHAYRLRIVLPGEGAPRTFRAPLPERFRRWLRETAARQPGRR